MARIIILLLILAALAILAVQNLATPVSLVILGSSRTPEIPFGLLLISAIGLGALITLVLYGLVGLQRPPESKYRPLGRRVPYPDGPAPASSGTPYSPAASYSSPRSSSTAFVNEPRVSEPRTPQDSVPPESASNRDPYGQVPFSTVVSGYADDYPSAYPDSAYPDSASSPQPPSTGERPGKKPLFSFMAGSQKKKSSRDREDRPENARIGDDWGDRRTAEHLNSWDARNDRDRDSGAGQQQRGFFDFIGNSNPPPNTDRLTEDIAAGWDENSPYANRYEGTRDSRTSYDYDEDLDSGWENFEGYDSSRPSDSSGPVDSPVDSRDRRVYRDGLYGDDDGDVEENYEDDGVYEADYRVIVPPSKPLDDREDELYP
jgi:hypothetical protein